MLFHYLGYLSVSLSSLLIICQILYLPIILRSSYNSKDLLRERIAGFKAADWEFQQIYEELQNSPISKRSTVTCEPGLPGARGKDGEDGTPGKEGLAGVRGIDARDQVEEQKCIICPTGPMGPIGAPGKTDIKISGFNSKLGLTQRRRTSHDYYCFFDWVRLTLGLKYAGDRGEDGEKGDKGSPGVPADDGVDGFMGMEGDIGDDGFVGRRGAKGPDGKNAPGGVGLPGPKGAVGPIGRAGSQGPRGKRNYIYGPAGDIGQPGPNGLDGKEGNMGDRGPKGPPGENGADAKFCPCPIELQMAMDKSRRPSHRIKEVMPPAESKSETTTTEEPMESLIIVGQQVHSANEGIHSKQTLVISPPAAPADNAPHAPATREEPADLEIKETTTTEALQTTEAVTTTEVSTVAALTEKSTEEVTSTTTEQTKTTVMSDETKSSESLTTIDFPPEFNRNIGNTIDVSTEDYSQEIETTTRRRFIYITKKPRKFY